MMYLQRSGNGTVDSSFVEVSSRKQDDLPGSKGKHAQPCPTSGKGQWVVGVGVSKEEVEAVRQLAAAIELCSFLLLLHLKVSCLVSLLWKTGTDLLWNSCSSTSFTLLPLEVIFILKIFHSNYLVLKWSPEWFILENGKTPLTKWELNSSTETVRLCVHPADVLSPYGGGEVTSTLTSMTADWYLQIQHGTISNRNNRTMSVHSWEIMGTWRVVDRNLIPVVLPLLPCCWVYYNYDRTELALSALWPAVAESKSVPAGRRSSWSQCEVDFSL